MERLYGEIDQWFLKGNQEGVLYHISSLQSKDYGYFFKNFALNKIEKIKEPKSIIGMISDLNMKGWKSDTKKKKGYIEI